MPRVATTPCPGCEAGGSAPWKKRPPRTASFAHGIGVLRTQPAESLWGHPLCNSYVPHPSSLEAGQATLEAWSSTATMRRLQLCVQRVQNLCATFCQRLRAMPASLPSCVGVSDSCLRQLSPLTPAHHRACSRRHRHRTGLETQFNRTLHTKKAWSHPNNQPHVMAQSCALAALLLCSFSVIGCHAIPQLRKIPAARSRSGLPPKCAAAASAAATAALPSCQTVVILRTRLPMQLSRNFSW